MALGSQKGGQCGNALNLHSLQLGEEKVQTFYGFQCLLYSHHNPSPISSVNACDEVKMCIRVLNTIIFF